MLYYRTGYTYSLSRYAVNNIVVGYRYWFFRTHQRTIVVGLFCLEIDGTAFGMA